MRVPMYPKLNGVLVKFAALLGVAVFLFPQAVLSQDPTLSGSAITVTGGTVYIESQQAQIRLWGLDVPEMSTPEGRKSKATMARLLRHCNPIKCDKVEVGPDGTVVARCLDFYGKDLAALMIRAGAGKENKSETRGDNPHFPDAWTLYEKAGDKKPQ